jgi:formylglycine-generating enzyme required for sulfatase activity
MSSIAVFHQPSTCRGFVQKLDERFRLEMIEIQAGTFQMGSPDQEDGHEQFESPLHEVTVPSFCMGRYPVTQAQWRFVAKLTKELNPEPSHFKGDDLPVECVSWLDADKFCQSLSVLTGRDFGLPSEAEWEYACRARTTTPFHFGETIAPGLATYTWSNGYVESEEINRTKSPEGTTSVYQSGVANAFGLSDMHGNVLEWCDDHWHDSYTNAPKDGRAWLDFSSNSDEGALRPLRGGSWHLNPRHCRSASRVSFDARVEFNFIGFRVVCSNTRTS